MTWFLVLLALGVNLLFWGIVGAFRWLHSALRADPLTPRTRLVPSQVAVLVAAHNEELGVGATVRAAHTQVPVGNVFVVSDGSSDATVAAAEAAGATVWDLHPNRGKAGALAAAIEHYRLADRFEVVMLLDADTAPAADYLESGLPLFDDPGVVAVAGRAATVWDDSEHLGLVGRILRAYRERLYVTFQVLIKYGQAARAANAVTIVPGFASMYRTRILTSVDISAPGLAIEDFNMTFEVHAHRLGRIAFHPRAAVAYTQDPHNLRDYMKQVGRWSLGFWQTVRRHGMHRGRFWWLLAVYVIEVLTSSVVFVLLVPALLVSLAGQLWLTFVGQEGPASQVAGSIAGVLPPEIVLLGVVLPDFVLTVGVAIAQRRPAYLPLGLLFVPLRCLDAWLCLRALWRSRTANSAGTWASPERRAPVGGQVPVPAVVAARPDASDRTDPFPRVPALPAVPAWASQNTDPFPRVPAAVPAWASLPTDPFPRVPAEPPVSAWAAQDTDPFTRVGALPSVPAPRASAEAGSAPSPVATTVRPARRGAHRRAGGHAQRDTGGRHRRSADTAAHR